MSSWLAPPSFLPSSLWLETGGLEATPTNGVQPAVPHFGIKDFLPISDVQNRIVTVVSAGNLGRTSEHPRIWGGITRPGNDPAVITVAPLNIMASATHSDDVATSYGSRGATYIDGLSSHWH